MHSTKARHAAISKREMAYVALLLFALGALAVRPSIRGNDGVGHYVYLASLIQEGDLDFTNNYVEADAVFKYGSDAHYATGFSFSALPRSPRTGLPGNRYGVGAALLWSPLVLLTRAFHSSHLSLFAHPYECAVGWGTMLWTSAGLLLLYIFLRRDFSRFAAGWTIAALVLATPLGFYMYAHGSMSHGAAFFAVAGLFIATDRVLRYPIPANYAIAGALLSLAFITRFQDAVWCLLLGMTCLSSIMLPKPLPSVRVPRWVNLVFLFAAAGLVLLPQLAAWKIINGAWLSGPAPYLNKEAGAFAFPGHILAVLFGTRRGIFLWHPLFAVAVVGTLIAFFSGRKFRDTWQQQLDGCALAGLGLTAILVGSWSIWYGGASFGNRFFISALPPLAPGLALLLDLKPTRRARILWSALLLILIAWNTGLLIQYALEWYPREGEVPFTQIIHQNIIELPPWLLTHHR